MKNLPYMRWFPADADGDEKYASLNDEELGFFHRLLNKSWINTGLPSDLDELSDLMHISRAQLNKRWKKVGRCWNQDGDRLFNPRQEVERAYAIRKSERATESVQTRYRKATNVPTNEGSNEVRTTYQSESESESEGRIRDTQEGFVATAQAPTEIACVRSPSIKLQYRNQSATIVPMSQRFQEWLSKWPACGDRDGAAQMWLSSVKPEDEAAAFACRDRYLASDRVKRGIIQEPKTFIDVQTKSGWSGTWLNDATQLDPEIALIKEMQRKVDADDERKRNGSKSTDRPAKGLERFSETSGRWGTGTDRNVRSH